jgi:hypothetical protein
MKRHVLILAEMTPSARTQAVTRRRARCGRRMTPHSASALGSANGPPKAGLSQTRTGTEPIRYSIHRGLRLQALLDGELAELEARQAVESLSAHRETQLLLKELSLVKSILADTEAARRVPQKRESYWNTIWRAIAGRATAEPEDAGGATNGVGVGAFVQPAWKERFSRTAR